MKPKSTADNCLIFVYNSRNKLKIPSYTKCLHAFCTQLTKFLAVILFCLNEIMVVQGIDYGLTKTSSKFVIAESLKIDDS